MYIYFVYILTGKTTFGRERCKARRENEIETGNRQTVDQTKTTQVATVYPALPWHTLPYSTFGNPLTLHKQSFVCLCALHTWIVAHSTFIHMLKDPSRLSVRLCQRLRCASPSCRYSNIFHWQISQFSTFIPFSLLAAGHGPKYKRLSFTYCSFTQPQPLCLCSPPLLLVLLGASRTVDGIFLFRLSGNWCVKLWLGLSSGPQQIVV